MYVLSNYIDNIDFFRKKPISKDTKLFKTKERVGIIIDVYRSISMENYRKKSIAVKRVSYQRKENGVSESMNIDRNR